ncbi:MAG: type I restriction enzyme HsdR N-terminal domain-containing protein [Bacteroidetes bacterium]|nr:type I restriction enzyme HsdR N-terminal domain-containing protein [Bacteroidota bacterium]
MQFNWENIGIKTRVEKNKQYFFDPIRKRYLLVTPEEEVRQWIIYHLTHELDYPATNIAVEKQIKYLKRNKRFDVLIYKGGEPKLLIECKAPNVAINQLTLNQIATYNFTLNVPYLLLTNGAQQLCCRVNSVTKTCEFLSAIPPYKSL